MFQGQVVRDAQWWDGLLSAFEQQQELGVAAFCLSRGVRPWQFHYQRRKREREGGSGLVEAEAEPVFREYLLPSALPPAPAREARPVPAAGSPIRIHVGTLVIELAPGFDGASLRAVLACCR